MHEKKLKDNLYLQLMNQTY